MSIGIADRMRTLASEVKKSKENLRDYKRFRTEREDQRKEDEEMRGNEREKFIRHLISNDRNRLQAAKQKFIERRNELKKIFKGVDSFLGDVQEQIGEIHDELHEAHATWRSITKSFRKNDKSHNGRMKIKKHTKKSKKKKRK